MAVFLWSGESGSASTAATKNELFWSDLPFSESHIASDPSQMLAHFFGESTTPFSTARVILIMAFRNPFEELPKMAYIDEIGDKSSLEFNDEQPTVDFRR